MGSVWNKARLQIGLVVATLLGTWLIVAPTPASAAGFTYDAYAPKKIGSSKAQGWAKVSRDCSGTYGCWNYMKIERHNWWGTSFVGGAWVTNNGWNSVTATLPSGCGEYRTWVDSYNDTVGSVGAGVNLGPVGVSQDGQAIYRFKRTWNSGWERLCR